MDGILGALAGGGMLVLIGLLAAVFFMEMGWLSGEKGKWLGRCFLTVLSACILHRLLGALFYFLFYGLDGNAAEYQKIFRSPMLEKVYALLQAPRWDGWLTGLFAYLGHGLGKMLFGQLALGGEVLAFLCTFSAYALVTARLQHLFGKKTGDQMAFLLLCLPFSVFFFLPGWAPLMLLRGALIFYFAGRLLPEREIFISSVVHYLMIGLLSMLSAVMVFSLATGRLI